MKQTQKEKSPKGAKETSIERKDSNLSAKQKQSIKRLRDVYRVEHYKAYPSIPENCKVFPSAWKPTTANGLSRMITDWLRLNGHHCERIANMGRVVDNTKTYVDCIGMTRTIGSKKWIKGSGTRGTSDLHAVLKGRAVFIEIKATATDRQSSYQKQYQMDVERSGGHYWLVRSFGQFLELYDNFIEEVSHGS